LSHDSRHEVTLAGEKELRPGKRKRKQAKANAVSALQNVTQNRREYAGVEAVEDPFKDRRRLPDLDVVRWANGIGRS
jgi:hypothetical protein